MEAVDRDLTQGKLLYGITETDETKARMLVIAHVLQEWVEAKLAQLAESKPNAERRSLEDAKPETANDGRVGKSRRTSRTAFRAETADPAGAVR